MTQAATPEAGPNPPNRRPAKAAERKPRQRDRLRLELLLPESIITEVRSQIAADTQITPGLVERLDRELQITKRCGVSQKRLQNYLDRVRSAAQAAPAQGARSNTPTTPTREPSDSASESPDSTAEPSEATSGPSDPTSESTHPTTGPADELKDQRQRQLCIAAILDETFGQFAKSDPNLWSRRAYLMLVGVVYERLATSKKELSTDELIALAKVLAANRRAEAQLRKDRRPDDEPETPAPVPKGDLPEHLREAIRQIYGTNPPVTSEATD